MIAKIKQMKKITVILCLVLVVSCGQKTETKFVKSLDSVALKAQVKGAYIGGWIRTMTKLTENIRSSNDSLSRKKFSDTLLMGYQKIDSLFTDSTYNPMFKK